MRKLALFAGLVALLVVAIGCDTSDNVMSPADPHNRTDGRVIGTIQGTVTDGADNALLEGVEVTTTTTDGHVSTFTDATGHYAFTGLNPGSYVMTFTFPEAAVETKGVDASYAVGRTVCDVPTLEELTERGLTTERVFQVEVDGSVDLYPLIGGATGRVYLRMNDWSTVPGAGVTVVADFSSSRIVDNEFFAVCDADGIYMFDGLPAGTSGWVRTVPFSDGTYNYGTATASLSLSSVNFATPNMMTVSAGGGSVLLSNNFVNLGVAPGANLDMTFAGDVNTASFEFELYVDNMPWSVTPTFSKNTSVSLDPAGDMTPGKSCRLYVNGARYDFWTTGGTEPFVTATNMNSGVRFPISGNFMATFSMEMEPSTFSVDVNGMPVDVSWDGTTITIDPVQDLNSDTYYTIEMSGYGTNGAPYSDDYTVRTVDVPAPIMLTNNFLDRPFALDAALEMTFSMAMDPSSFEISLSGGVVFDAVWSEGDTKLTLTPAVPLAEDANYCLTLSGLSNSGSSFYFNDCFSTINYQEVIVVDHNLEDNFPVDQDLMVTFSQPMNPASFTDFGNIELKMNNNLFAFDASWSNDDMTLTVNPRVDFDMGANVDLSLYGMAAANDVIFSDSFSFDTFKGNDTYVVTHNVVSGEFPLEGNFEFTFADAMDPDEFDFRLLNDATSNQITGTTTWDETATIMTFDPDLKLLSAEGYRIEIDGMTAMGGDLVGGLGAIFGSSDYNSYFMTEGGLGLIANNLYFVDGSQTGFPVDSDLVFEFDADIALGVDGSYIVIERTDYPTSGMYSPILFTASADGSVLTLNPDQNLEGDTEYRVSFRVFSTVPGISYTTSSPFYFTTYSDPLTPTVAVTGLVHDEEADGWVDNGDYDQNDVTLSWGYQENADYYVVYARLADMAKSDFVAIALYENDTPDADGLLTRNISLTYQNPWEDKAAPSPIWADVFDSRSDDNVQTPFEGTNVLFKVAAANGLGETAASDVLSLADVVAPDGDNFGSAEQDGSADAGYVGEAPTEPHTFMVAWAAPEYLDHSSVVEFSLVNVEGVGDEDYGVTADDVVFSFEDDEDGYTWVVATVTVADMKNAAGDSLYITGGLKDTSGNDAVGYDLLEGAEFEDTTLPSGTWGTQSISADNSGGTEDITFDLDFTATELLDSAVTPTVGWAWAWTIPADGWNDADGITTVTVQFTVPAGENGGGELATITDFDDLFGNTMTDDVEYEALDTTAPVITAAQTAGSGDNTGGAVISQVEITFTSSEDMDQTVTPTVSISAGEGTVTGTQYTTPTTYVVTVSVPAGETATGQTVSFNGASDLQDPANVQAVATTFDVTD